MLRILLRYAIWCSEVMLVELNDNRIKCHVTLERLAQ